MLRSSPAAGSTIAHYFYYSVATQTLVGYGDFAPLHWAPQFFSCTQMMLGLFFNVIIIAVTTGNVDSEVVEQDRSFREGARKYSFLHYICVEQEWVRGVRRFIRAYLLWVTIAIQAVFYIVLFIMNGGSRASCTSPGVDPGIVS